MIQRDVPAQYGPTPYPYQQGFPAYPPAQVPPPGGWTPPPYGIPGPPRSYPLPGAEREIPPRPPRPTKLLVGLAIFAVIALLAGLAIAVKGARNSTRREAVSQELVDSIADQVSEIRELPWRQKIAWRTVTDEEMRNLIRQELEDISPEEKAELSAVEQLIKYLRVFPADVDLQNLMRDLVEEGILGFYDPETDELVVRQTGEDAGPMEKATLAHEIAHALVDQHFDLERIEEEIDRSDDSERSAAFDALVEGDASLVMIVWARRHLSSAEISRLQEESATAGRDVLESAPRIVRNWLEFPYDKGLEFVDAIQSGGGWEAVDDAYSAPPVSTKEILHPEEYIRSARRARSREGGDPSKVKPLTPSSGCEALDEGVIGELDLSLVLEEFVDVEIAKRAAEGWRADRYLFEKCGDKKVFRATIQAESLSEATELRDAWSRWIEGWSKAEGNYPIPPSVVPGVGGGKVTGNGSTISVILADDLRLADRVAA